MNHCLQYCIFSFLILIYDFLLAVLMQITMAIAREVAEVTRLGVEVSLKPSIALSVRYFSYDFSIKIIVLKLFSFYHCQLLMQFCAINSTIIVCEYKYVL